MAKMEKRHGNGVYVLNTHSNNYLLQLLIEIVDLRTRHRASDSPEEVQATRKHMTFEELEAEAVRFAGCFHIRK